MSTIFYAVQCCQCSTMQVKQRSKNNKWTCVICNQKQSARKVFAESPMARDLRPFVQSSNMTRQFTQQQEQQHDHTLVSDVHDNHAQKKRRTDWTEYLDAEAGQHGEMKQEDVESGGFEPQFVTELSPELFKKSKRKKWFDATGSGNEENDGVSELQNRRPVFRNSYKHVLTPADVEGWRCQLTMNKNIPNRSHLMMEDDKESRSLETENAKFTGASKWNDYITKDDSDGLKIINSKCRANNTEQWSNETVTNFEFEPVTTDERVEDDIHPDFL